ATAAYTDKFIMDRNFGAASAARADGIAKTRGLYYQFGRKDPLPGFGVYNASGTAVTTSCVPGTTSIKTAVQNPFNFYYVGGDWVSGNPYPGTSWNNPTWYTSTPAGKSLFDPCPPGWRLPVNGTWDTFALADNVPNASNYPDDYKGGNVQAGWEFYMSGSSGETAFYPAAGYRSPSSGVVAFERSHGASWSSTPSSGTGAYYLRFVSDNATSLSDWRSYCFPVRCVQE
ncbi:MAG: hypothetical protein LBP56_09065, partial [Odoribacteraceae bacterium]|nr:hypothetical protein [Odoribacteraceae bacterium]